MATAKATAAKRLEKIYRWRAGYSHSIDAGVVKQELDAINAETGAIRPRDIVDRARPEDNPMHGWFEWDNDVAGEQYRLQQARMMVRAIVVSHEPQAPPTPVYVNVTPAGEERTYRAVDAVINSPDELASAIKLLAARVVSAQGALDELKRYSQHLSPDVAARVSALSEALSVAHVLSLKLVA